MGYGCYATIGDIKSVLGITATTDDTVIRKIAEAASRSIDQYTNRRFYVTSETKYLDGAVILWVPDLLSITTLKTDEDLDLDYDNTYAATDYILYGVGLEDSLNTFPKTKIMINPNGNYSSFASGVKKGVQIVGVWGYGDGISVTPYFASGTTLDGTLTVGATAVAVNSITPHAIGQTILVETEQMYVEAIATTVMTVMRGVNGTTATTHASALATYIYQYPADIRQACIDLSVSLYQNRTKRGISSERLGDYSYTMNREMMNSIVDDSIRSYKRMRF